MNLRSSLSFLRRPASEALQHVQVKYVVASKSDNTRLARKKAETTAALRRIVTEQRLANAVAEQQAYDAVAQAILPTEAAKR